MKRIKSNPILISITLFIALVLLGIITGGFVVRDRLDHIVYGNKFLQIDGQYESEIAAQKDNLSTITIHMKNPALENVGDITFQILEGKSVIREVGFTGKNIGDPGDIKLKFDPIIDSAGKKYEIKILTYENNPKVSVFVDDKDHVGGWYYYRNTSGMAGIIKTVSTLFRKVVADRIFSLLWIVSLSIVTLIYFKSEN